MKNNIINFVDYKDCKIKEKIIKRSKSLKWDEIPSQQGEHPVPPNTKCSCCHEISNKMYSRAIFKDGEINFCSRDCVVKWGQTHPI